MDNQKIYLLAEIPVLLEFLDDVKAAFKQALVPTLQEPGCEALFGASLEGDPHKLVFFKVFSSLAAYEFHLEQDYTKRMFTGTYPYFCSVHAKMTGQVVVKLFQARSRTNFR